MKDDEKKTKLTPMYHEGHKLRTRRDFLAQGFLGMSAMTVMPSIASLLASSAARAVTCDFGGGPGGLSPIIIIDLAGGGNVPGSNVMVGGAGGQLDLLANYESLGLPSQFNPNLPGQINTELGLAFHSDSGILRGIRQSASTSTRSKVDGALFVNQSGDDTMNNQHNPIYWLNKAGAKGQLTQTAGTHKTESGGNSKCPMESVNPAIAPVELNTPQDALNLVSVGKLRDFFDNDGAKVERVLGAMASLSETKLKAIPDKSLPERIKSLVHCGFQQTSEQIRQFSPDVLDPRLDPHVQAIFDNIQNNDQQKKTATIGKLVLDGHIGVATMSLGGYDYHDGTRSLGERRDFELGQVMGWLFELAARKEKNLVIYVYTDGGVSTNNVLDETPGGRGKFIWLSDSGNRSSSFMMAYQHSGNGRPPMRSPKRQVGKFKADGSVDAQSSLVANNVVNLSKAVVANYLALHGQEGRLAEIVGTNPFGSQLDEYLVFDKFLSGGGTSDS